MYVFSCRPMLGDDGELTEESARLLAEKGWDGIGHNGPPPRHRL